MTDRAALKTLVAICNHLSIFPVTDDNFPLWSDALLELLPFCENAPELLCPVIYAAERAANAQRGQDRRDAILRLGHEMRRYNAVVAVQRLDAWRASKSEAA